ncbi:MAG: hypothetical protein M1587_01035 [Thaumarchaeota archaeon]|nr:hypothetical protein [Nitrososphaerota archaeon]MCL5068960.1 hypothetical protein [Nitrososphaerota archaeon]
MASENSIALIRSYPELARELLRLISSARREIYLAPRYYEPAIGSKLLAKFAEGVSIHLLDTNACGVYFEERIRTALTHETKNRELMLRLLNTPDAILQCERLDYSFVVVDGKYCGFELVNPSNPDEFNLAVKLESVELAVELIHVFNNLAHNSNFSVQSRAVLSIGE